MHVYDGNTARAKWLPIWSGDWYNGGMDHTDLAGLFPELEGVGTLHKERFDSLHRAADKLKHVDAELALKLHDIAEAVAAEHLGWRKRKPHGCAHVETFRRDCHRCMWG